MTPASSRHSHRARGHTQRRGSPAGVSPPPAQAADVARRPLLAAPTVRQGCKRQARRLPRGLLRPVVCRRLASSVAGCRRQQPAHPPQPVKGECRQYPPTCRLTPKRYFTLYRCEFLPLVKLTVNIVQKCIFSDFFANKFADFFQYLVIKCHKIIILRHLQTANRLKTPSK